MICILNMKPQEPWNPNVPPIDQITGWIVAADIDDARRQIPIGDEWQGLAGDLYRMTFTPPPGKYPLTGGLWMLVS